MNPLRIIWVVPFILCMITGSGFPGDKSTQFSFAVQDGGIDRLKSELQPTLDPVSEFCLRCHDGIHASSADATSIDTLSQRGRTAETAITR